MQYSTFYGGNITTTTTNLTSHVFGDNCRSTSLKPSTYHHHHHHHQPHHHNHPQHFNVNNQYLDTVSSPQPLIGNNNESSLSSNSLLTTTTTTTTMMMIESSNENSISVCDWNDGDFDDDTSEPSNDIVFESTISYNSSSNSSKHGDGSGCGGGLSFDIKGNFQQQQQQWPTLLNQTVNENKINATANANANENTKKRRNTSKSSSSSSTYKHVPHREKPVHLVARRNARERKRVQAVNNAFVRLRKCVPVENRNKRLSKVKTLHRAIEYIAALEKILHGPPPLPPLPLPTNGSNGSTTDNNQHQEIEQLVSINNVSTTTTTTDTTIDCASVLNHHQSLVFDDNGALHTDYIQQFDHHRITTNKNCLNGTSSKAKFCF